MMLMYSIIIPVFNSEKSIENCIKSVLNNGETSYEKYEVIVVDDCSTDKTNNILKKFSNQITVLKTLYNDGPGSARNVGLNHAKGNYIMFLDSDDELKNDALSSISNFINFNKKSNFDIIAYNWEYISHKGGGRYDLHSLKKTKVNLLKDYISLYCDGSVIYTLINRNFLNRSKVFFRSGFHEDVDFMYKLYSESSNIGILDKELYLKRNSKDSIVNTISEKHIDGYIGALQAIFNHLKSENNLQDNIDSFKVGLVGFLASRIIAIFSISKNEKERFGLYSYLKKIFKIFLIKNEIQNLGLNFELETKYLKIYNFFSRFKNNISLEDTKKIDLFLSQIIKKSWSCYDIHNSLFLAPDQVRTCCKRFFRNGKMKGDVVLVESKNQEINKSSIEKAKKKILTEINQGVSEDCLGCPFLEFKHWKNLEPLDIEHISFEYHSVCTMKCIYCSDKFYGGKKPTYNISNLLKI